MAGNQKKDPQHISRKVKMEACRTLASGMRTAEDIATELGVPPGRLARWQIEFGDGSIEQLSLVKEEEGRAAVERALRQITRQNEAGEVTLGEATCLRLIAAANLDEERLIRVMRRMSRNPQLLSAINTIDKWVDGQPPTPAHGKLLRLLGDETLDAAALLGVLRSIPAAQDADTGALRQVLVGMLGAQAPSSQELINLLKRSPDAKALRPAINVLEGWPAAGSEDPKRLAVARMAANGEIDSETAIGLLRKTDDSAEKRPLLDLLSRETISTTDVLAVLKRMPDAKPLRRALDIVGNWPKDGAADKTRLAVAKLAASDQISRDQLIGLLKSLPDAKAKRPALSVLENWPEDGSTDKTRLAVAKLAASGQDQISQDQLIGLLKSLPDAKAKRPALSVLENWPEDGSSDPGRLAAAKLVAKGDVDRADALGLLRKLSGQKGHKGLFDLLAALGDDPLPSDLHKALLSLLKKDEIAVSDLIGLFKKTPEGKALRPALNVLDSWPMDGGVDEGRALAMRMLPSGPLKEADVINLLRKVTTNRDLQSVLNAYESGSFEDDGFSMLWQIFRRGAYMEDGCGTIAEAKWLEDPAFNKAYNAATKISAWGHDIRWRVYTLLKSAQTASKLEGDFVECGVDRGGTALAVITYLTKAAFRNRDFYLFDTFKGLERSQLTEEERGTSLVKDERYPNVLGDVQKTFKPHGFTRIVPGAVPETLDAFKGDKVAYLHIDMNVAHPETSALEFFWPKLSMGAPVIFDDYGFPHHAPQRRALDEMAAKLGSQIMMLPTCQGLMWKT